MTAGIDAATVSAVADRAGPDVDTARFMDEFARRIKLLRVAAGLSQAELADAAGMHRTFYGQLERGQRGMNIAGLPGLAHALGVSVPALFAGEGDLVAELARRGPAGARHRPGSPGR